jgi:hypothetical protein
MLRELTSSTTTYPAISPVRVSSRPSSGSGTLLAESARMAIGSPSVTTRQAGDLKNSSGRSARYTRA